ENLALGAELARQLCHDFRNFIYNLTLQLEIQEASATALAPKDWESIKREGKKIANWLQEWDRFRRQSPVEDPPIDLNRVVRRIAEDLAAEGRTLALGPSIGDGALSVTGAEIGIRFLLRLLIEDALQERKEGLGDLPLLIEAERSQEEA